MKRARGRALPWIGAVAVVASLASGCGSKSPGQKEGVGGAGASAGTGGAGRLMHWDGARWATTLGSTQGRWYGIWGRAANDVWVVGLNGRNGAVQRFDGSAWHAVAIATTSPLTAVWGTGTGAVFVGAG